MNTALKIHQPAIDIQGSDMPASDNSRQFSLRVFKVILGVFAATFLAIGMIWLQFHVEETYMQVENIESKNRNMGEDISRLEAEVESLMSYQRIDSVVRQYDLGVHPPERAFHINLKSSYHTIARAGEAASGG